MEDEKIMMMAAACQTLDYKKQNPNASIEEIFDYLLKSLKVNENAKVKAMATASRVIKYKEENPAILDKELIQKVMSEISLIARNSEDLMG